MNIKVTKTKASRLADVDFEKLEFGDIFSDHMVIMDYKDGRWLEPEIVPYGPMDIFPALCTFHYGQAIFEGLKGFYGSDDSVKIFRPERYHQRMIRSSKRLCIPPIDYKTFIGSLRELLALDKEWIPRKKGYSLYIRPFIIAMDNFLGVKVSDTYRFMIITSPVGAYYKEGINPVKLVTSGEYVRAVRGGLGMAKTPANYAASLLPGEEAKHSGFTQVLWLDGVERKYIEEVGTMNIFFVIDDELVTPPLEGSVLDGITRQTVIHLWESLGRRVAERRISIDEVLSHARDGGLTEVFGTGTAAVISPVGEIQHGATSVTINGGKIGPMAQTLYNEITGIQYGERPDRFNWCYVVQ
ncbi:MAG: Branched-chain-amino-acid aminotransferase 2 [Syntrophorhabdus sp. PtaU1.Bin050]|nr:MAG: Branched-chain-amino-acid aminotransferase 2 [Syntrophorhabdus sp. PtaU1.Bin050]